MSKFGITNKGFKRRNYLDILSKIESELKSSESFGENIDFSQKDPLYQFTVPYAILLSELWEVAEHVFYSASPRFSEGINLKNTGKYIGIAAKESTKSRGVNALKLTGEKDSNILKGLQVSTESGITFETTETVKINEEGEAIASIIAIEYGEKGNVPKNTITNILNPTIGLKSVTNVKETIGGQDVETDVEFRERYDKSISQKATNIYDSIMANVLKITGVKDVLLINNNTMKETNGVPPKSFHTIVLGGKDSDVAKAIFEKYPAGIEPFGNIKIDVEDSRGNKQPIGFSRPHNKDIYFRVKLKTNEKFPSDGDERIKKLLNKYIEGFNMGQDVILYKIICGIGLGEIGGIEDIEIETSLDGVNYNPENIKIDNLTVAVTSEDKIEVVQ